MIRNIFISLLFFFGPALLMIVLRHMFLLFKIWLMLRKQQRQTEHVIDITPRPSPTSPGKIFILASFIVGLLCASWVWYEMSTPDTLQQRYIPAQLDAHGKLIPGHYERIPSNHDDNHGVKP